MKSSLVWLVLVFEIGFNTAFSQDSAERMNPLRFSVSTTLNYSFGFVHSERVQTSNSFPIGFTTDFNWQRVDRQDFDVYHCLPRHSLQIAYYDYDKAILGKGVNVSYSLEPHFMLNERVSLYPKFSAGLCFLSNPYDSLKNPDNEFYSLPVNVYLGLGVGLRWQFSKRWAMNLNTEYQHISNGGLYQPNIGMNWSTVGVSMEYSPLGLVLKKYKHPMRTEEKFRSKRFDVQIFGSMKHGDFAKAGQFYSIAGLNLTRSWQASRIHAWTAAVEVYQDRYLLEHISTGGSGNRLGVLGGHEFLLGKYIFSQQIGFYLAGRNQDNLVYHRWGLYYFFLPRWSFGINLLVHKQTADFADLRLAYSFHGH